MNLLKKIWITITDRLLSRQVTDEKVISTIEKVWENHEKKNEIVSIIQSSENKKSKARIIATINRIEKEIKTLEGKKEKNNERLAKITEIETSTNFTEIDKSLDKIQQLIETKPSLINSIFFTTDTQKFDDLLTNNNLLKQFNEREDARKRLEELQKKQVREKLARGEVFIEQGKLDEAKLLIAQIQKQIKKSYKNELGQLSKLLQKLKEKELQALKQQQEEAQRKRDQEAKRLKEIETRRQEELRKRKEQQKREEQEQQAKLKKQREVEDRIREERQQEESRKWREKEKKERQAKAELENLLVKKHNWQEFQQVLQQNGITTLYHFTDLENIKSIKRHGGLYSWHYCDRNDIIIPHSGGGTLSRQLDQKYNLQDYVRVSFTRNHPMMYVANKAGRIQNPVILTINLDVCFFKETRFADMNATKTGHNQGKSLDDLKGIHFKTVKQPNHFNLDESEKTYFQAEVLVKTWIPIKHITNINKFQ